jgi:hypothetical protein
MALISTIDETTKERQKVHAPTRCLASSFTTDEGQPILQLDTYGADNRQFPEKVSQSLQFDEAAARELLRLIRQTFPGLGKT